MKIKNMTLSLSAFICLAAAVVLWGCTVSYKFTGTSIDYTKTKSNNDSALPLTMIQADNLQTCRKPLYRK